MLTSLVEVLEEKGILTQEEWETKIKSKVEKRSKSASYRIEVQALVGTTVAYPGYVWLTPFANIGYGSYTYNFYEPSVSAGSHTVKIQWKVDGGTGQVYSRTLTVIALPS